MGGHVVVVVAVTVQDLVTQWIQSSPLKTKTSQGGPKVITWTIHRHVEKIVQIRNSNIVRQHYIDPRQNVIAESAVRWGKEGTSAILL